MFQQVEEAVREIEEGKDRRFKNDHPTSPIKRIWQQHHEVIRLAVLGFKPADIARMTDFTPLMIRNILGSEVVKRQIAVMQGARDAETLDIKAEIDALAPTAIRVLRDIMESEDESGRNKLAAATDILDRAGYAAPKVIVGDIKHRHGLISQEDLDELKRRAREAKMTIDVTPCVASE